MTTRNFENIPASTLGGHLFWREEARERTREIGDILNFGRDSANHIVIRDEYVSARHARIERKDDSFVVRDLRSRNGTYVNGARVFEAWLRDGDVLQIGRHNFRFGSRKDGSVAGFSLISKNAAWAAELTRVPSLAGSSHPLLLTGPSGAGKDLLAQAIHQLSPRRLGPFVSVNCSTFSESLAESELFGHRRGSFTGAVSDRQGAFEAARGGTLFLDEIGDLPPNLQPKLLRALENRQIRPIGSDQAIDVDVRIVTATHRNLKEMIFNGDFRQDLFYRLNVLRMSVPSLLERMADFEDFFYLFAREERVRFSHDAIEALKRHSWPGNLRELRNIVRRAKAIFIDREVREVDVERLIDVVHTPGPRPPALNSRSVIKEIESEIIRARLIANHGNQRRTANDLGIPKSTLHDRIRSYGIDLKVLKQRF